MNIRANHEKPWYTHALGQNKDFNFKGWGICLALECKNMLDQQYDVVLNYPMPDRAKDIYLTDAKNYVNPGALWCFGPDGVAKWSVRTGDIPAHMVFVEP